MSDPGPASAARRRLLIGLAVVAFGAASIASGARADRHEEILAFVGRVVVHADATLTVTETIRVRAAGREIKRGIYRDFPTTYRDRFGIAKRVGFRIKSVERDGLPLAYWTEQRGGGVRVYMGRKDIRIAPGVYTYGLTYRTDRQIGYFDTVDEIYWNVTGNDWAFDIRRAEAVMVPPPGAAAVQYTAFTGPRGAQGRDFEVTTAPDGNLRFVTTRTLGRGEGLTVAIGWPKGFVVEPGSAEKAATAIRDNLTLVAAVIGLLLVIAYYLWAWDRVGRDPKAGTIVPLFGPPEGFSPAATRTLVRMGTDDKAFAAAVVSMAVKGYLKIDEKSGGFAVQRVSDDDSMLSPGEKALARKLCPSRAWVEISVTNHKRISDTKKALEAKLKQELHKIYFNTNRRYLIPGAALTVLTIVAVALASADTATVFIVGFLAVWLSVWTSAVLGFIMASVHGWRTALSGRLKDVSAAIVVTAFAVGFLAGEVMGVFFLAEATSPAAAAILLATALMIPLFYGLLKAPTLKGRRILDEIEGFKMYLSTAEKERLETLHPPEDTPELFEKYLPYALALGVENQWSERFADVLAATEPAEGGGYHPGWYSGRAWSGQGVGNFGNTLGGSLSSALASSAAGPVSSGSGGGGSGGGGGGGGGGGF